MPSGIMESLILAAFTAVGIVAWWGIKRIVYGQDQIHETLTDIRDSLGSTVTRVAQLETWVETREQMDNLRHAENRAAIQALKDEINANRKKR